MATQTYAGSRHRGATRSVGTLDLQAGADRILETGGALVGIAASGLDGKDDASLARPPARHGNGIADVRQRTPAVTPWL